MSLPDLAENRIVRVVAIVLIALSLWAGVTRQQVETKYPSYDDSGDAYSEQIIRNSVVNAISGIENRAGSLIWTRGYGSGDIAYYADGTIRYHSNLGLQAALFAQIARSLGGWFEDDPDRTFAILRFLNGLLLVTCLAIFFRSVCRGGGIALAATLVMSVSSGVALFGGNLYFMYWLMFTSLPAMPLLLRGHDRTYVLAAFVASLAYFAVRYEFATTFALMWLLPVVLIAPRKPKSAIRTGIAAFAAVCAGFVAIVLLHHLRVAMIEGVTISEASSLVFEKLRLRVASLENVPAPFSTGFVKQILFRWTEVAFAVEDVFTVSRILLAGLFACLCIRDRASHWLVVHGWAVATYASWYAFGYQHIMQHYSYDAMLFTCTITLTVVTRLLAPRCLEIGDISGRRPQGGPLVGHPTAS